MNCNSLISNEKYNVEFKRELPGRQERYLKTVVAFLNSDTIGYLFIGIDDISKKSYPLNIDDTITTISQQLKIHIKPYENIKIDTFIHEEHTIIVLVVEPGNNAPYSYSDNLGEKYYIRNGNETIVADNISLKKLLFKGDNIRFDELFTTYKLEDLTFDNLNNRYSEINGKNFSTQMFESFELVNKDGYLNNTGLLLSDKNPIKDAYCNCIRFEGLDRAYVLDKQIFSGSIIQQLDEVRKFLIKNMKVGYHKENHNTIKDYEYPIEAVMEAIVNAIAHRNYLDDGTQVDVYMYDDRLEISSTGIPYSGLDISEIAKDPKSHRRNKLLCDLLERLEHMDRDGSGILRIHRLCKEHKIKHEFYQRGKDVYVKFYSNSHKEPSWPINAHIDDRYETILNFLETNDFITIQDCKKLFKIKKSAASILLKKYESDDLLVNISKRPLRYTKQSTK